MVQPSEPNREIRDIARYTSLGLQFGLTFIIFCVLGYFLDRWLDSSPLGLIAGVLLGGLGACWSLYRAVFPSSKEPEDKTK